jgi:hypothetical protein
MTETTTKHWICPSNPDLWIDLEIKDEKVEVYVSDKFFNNQSEITFVTEVMKKIAELTQ